ncbi:Galactokinase/mevalonate kinase [Candidatus Methylopumilus planktonicus]|uniref:Galactokinase/mevalonate kinase n=1 Tax=Candidatus Methylopumilus planktonicus TaxID=1581557 RepID=A0A0D6EVN4_9PROT|nr:galactokinase [Candidatus Methylopumilus planktonicus]CEZ19790.1 Galactokinase/mevalonate kinase [Candidatus Methylopumilus planktonicus]
MIIARSPLRISLGGGGTDLPSYYKQHEGFLVSAAIDKYIYVAINKPFNKGGIFRYSSMENSQDVDSIKHPIIREALKLFDEKNLQIEISSMADIPAGTGLGSSGSFTTALLKALYVYNRRYLSQQDLAELACFIEIEKLREPIGKQDQYIASVGGISSFAFHKDDTVTYSALNLSSKTLYQLEDNLLLFFTGFSRSASEILKDQKIRSDNNEDEILNNLHYTKDIGYKSKKALEEGDLISFGELMHEHWQHKKNRSSSMSNEKINEWYELALTNGAIGGKVVGAGGGGFLMFMAKDPEKLRQAMGKEGLEEVRFRFDFEGTKIVLSS